MTKLDKLIQELCPEGVEYKEISEVTNYEQPSKYIVKSTVQSRIVNVLDNFDAICTDLSSGLPAEIEARQKQYEYYRDKLLSFEEKI